MPPTFSVVVAMWNVGVASDADVPLPGTLMSAGDIAGDDALWRRGKSIGERCWRRSVAFLNPLSCSADAQRSPDVRASNGAVAERACSHSCATMSSMG